MENVSGDLCIVDRLSRGLSLDFNARGLTSCDVINRANNEATPSRNGNSDHFLQLAAIQTHAGLSQRQMMKKKISVVFS